MRRTLIFLALCLSLHAVAQTRVCIGGDLDGMSASSRHACDEQARLVGGAAAVAAVPAEYQLVVVCGEDGWKDYAAFAGRSDSELSSASADMDVATKTIFLRGSGITSASAAASVLTRSLSPATGDGVLLAQL